jgi:hypothetical protein
VVVVVAASPELLLPSSSAESESSYPKIGLPAFSWRCRIGSAEDASGNMVVSTNGGGGGGVPSTTKFTLGGVTVESNGTGWSTVANFTPHEALHTSGGAKISIASRSSRSSPISSAKIFPMKVHVRAHWM